MLQSVTRLSVDRFSIDVTPVGNHSDILWFLILNFTTEIFVLFDK